MAPVGPSFQSLDTGSHRAAVMLTCEDICLSLGNAVSPWSALAFSLWAQRP